MQITNYQMHNVLKVYTNQLSKGITGKSGRPTIRKPNSDLVRISAEGKRQNLINRVAADIVARITKEGIGGSASRNAHAVIQNEAINHKKSSQNRNDQFEYNVMNESAEKKTNKLSVENAAFLIRRIEELSGGPEPASGEN
jgi:hypothetical protein